MKTDITKQKILDLVDETNKSEFDTFSDILEKNNIKYTSLGGSVDTDKNVIYKRVISNYMIEYKYNKNSAFDITPIIVIQIKKLTNKNWGWKQQ